MEEVGRHFTQYSLHQATEPLSLQGAEETALIFISMRAFGSWLKGTLDIVPFGWVSCVYL